jgi:hypothetical protein
MMTGEQWTHREYLIHHGREFIRTTTWETAEGGTTTQTTWARRRIQGDASVAARRVGKSVRESVADDIYFAPEPWPGR